MEIVGFQRFTADGALGSSGKAAAVYSVFMESAAGGAGDVVLRNGTGTGDTAIYSVDGTGANGNDFVALAGGAGVVFPDGCFVDVGSNVDAVVVAYKLVGS